MTSRTVGAVAVAGERIYYESVGDGDPVVLCHGLAGNHGIWWRVVPALAEHHRVITWDQRGFGNSTRSTGSYGPETAVGDLVALLDHLELDEVQVIGQSMGGWVAMGVSLRHRHRLRSLVLTDTLAGVFTDEVLAEVNKTRPDVVARASAGGAGNHPALGERFCRDHPDLAFLYEQISSMGDKPDDGEVFAMLAAMRAPLEQVAELDIPAVLVVGKDDKLCPPAAMGLIAARIAGSELHIIDDAGHSPYYEYPESWIQVVEPFLARHAGSTASRR